MSELTQALIQEAWDETPETETSNIINFGQSDCQCQHCILTRALMVDSHRRKEVRYDRE